MKITKRQLRRIIKEEKTKLLDETKARRIIRKVIRESYEDRDDDREYRRGLADNLAAMPEPLSREEIRRRVHQFLIDKKYFSPMSPSHPFIDMFKPLPPGAPRDAQTSLGALRALEAAVASGEIDWADMDEIEVVWRQIDRMAD